MRATATSLAAPESAAAALTTTGLSKAISLSAGASASSIRAAKKALRAKTHGRIDHVPRELILAQSAVASHALFTRPAFKDARRISVFVSMPAGEINTTSLIVTALEMKKQVFIPYIHRRPRPDPVTAAGGSDNEATMEMLQIYSAQDLYDLKPDKWGIPSLDPVTTAARHNCFGGVGIDRTRQRDFPDAGVDLIVMPGLAFDRDLNRLGHGKGYYDRFLARIAKERLKRPVLVGIALAEQLLPDGETIPTDRWDERLDELILGDGTSISRQSLKPAEARAASVIVDKL